MAHIKPSQRADGAQTRDPAIPIVRARGVTKIYRAHFVEVPALTNVDFAVERGEMVAIMGPSGSGKTTLLNCLAGLDTPDQGTVEIDGEDLAEMSDAKRTDFRARSMGFVFQNFNLLPVLNAVENVEMPLLVLHVPSKQARIRAREMLSVVGLAERERHLPAELSGGQRQRVAIARALVTQPAIVWADEPTGNLDSEAAAEVMELLAGLNRSLAQTVVLVTHAPDIGARADRIVTMRDGSIAPSPTPLAGA